MTREAAHVHLVHDGPRGWALKGNVALPVVYGDVDDDALHRGRRVLARPACRVATVPRGNHDAAAVRIEEHFVGIEAHPARGVERALHLIAVQLARSHVRHEHVPVVVRAVGRWIEANRARRPGVVDTIEQQQLDSCCVFREDTEVDPRLRRGEGERRPQRRTAAVLEAVAHGLPSSSLAAAATRPGSKPNFF
jgi:hypothetical protein